MNRNELDLLKDLFGNSFIGPEQVDKLLARMGLPALSEQDVPEMNYPMDVLRDKADEYLLVMGFAGSKNNPLDIIKFRDSFGIDPDKSEPCLYNQDWYLAEDFVRTTLEKRWYLIKRDVYEDSRAVLPNDLIKRKLSFPSAVLCVYTFFAYFFSYGEYLWYHDFIWCCDEDHNGDRIYVGKYHDIDGINKNGFSIHRHLALRNCYASTDCV